jgi:hypothetical protein
MKKKKSFQQTPTQTFTSSGNHGNAINSVTSKSEKKQKKRVATTPLLTFGGKQAFYAIPMRKQLYSGSSSAIPSSNDLDYVKYFYCKLMTNDNDYNNQSKLMVTNISKHDDIRKIFNLLLASQNCQVLDVEIGRERMGIVTVDSREVDLSLLTQEECLHLLKDVETITQTNCLDRWLEEYKRARPDRLTIGREADEAMEEFEKIQQEEQERLNAPIVDEEGFTLVVSKRSNKRPPPSTAMKDGKSLSSKQPKTVTKKRKKQLMDENLSFYKFERKRQRQVEMSKLKDQFKNDRKRVQRLRSEISTDA